MLFADRTTAGKMLAEQIAALKPHNPIVIALPRGGVPVGFEVAKRLNAPLTVLIVRKIGSPFNSEYGIGAIAEGTTPMWDKQATMRLGITSVRRSELKKKEQYELQRRVRLYRQGKRFPSLKNRVAILVDDGLATGITAQAAIQAAWKKHPKEIIFASPICAHDTASKLRVSVDAVVCISTPMDLQAIGAYYLNFEQVKDEEVISYLRESHRLTTA